MAGQVHFLGMTEAQMRQFAEENPTRVDDLDTDGSTLLFTAAWNGCSDLVTWLVDEKRASVLRKTTGGLTPLHYAKSLEIVSFLLARGADVTALDQDGWTPLMEHAFYKQASCVKRLLKEPRVIETIDAKTTREIENSSARSTALHFACAILYGTEEERNKILEMLLLAGADPTILNDRQEKPLNLLQFYDPDNYTAISLLERALAEPQRTFPLAKVREINDANHAIAKAKEDAQRKILTATPPCLRERVREQQHQQQQQQQHLLLGPPLPRVELLGSGGEEEAKKRHATLQYVLRAEELGETGGMSSDVFVELMEMMTPRWDPVRRVNGNGEGCNGGEGGGGGAGAQG